MEDDLGPADRSMDTFVGTEVALDDLDVASERGEVRAAPSREVVEHADLVASLEQRLDEVRADEPGASRDQDPCHCRLPAVTGYAGASLGTGTRGASPR